MHRDLLEGAASGVDPSTQHISNGDVPRRLLTLNLLNVSCHAATRAAGPEGVSTHSVCQFLLGLVVGADADQLQTNVARLFAEGAYSCIGLFCRGVHDFL